jgi:membrane protein YqaA with SNARE-associated domain
MPLFTPTTLAAKIGWQWLWHLGGPGMILVGLADNSVIPTPGGMDILAIILTVRHRDLWWYYGLMAVVGAVIGGYVSYRVGRKGGKEALDKRFGAERMEKVYKKFERGGFLTVFVPAILPPPFPTAPFLVAAGALNFPQKQFFVYLTIARAIRYMGLTLLAFLYGRWIMQELHHYYKPLLWTFTILLVAGGIAGGIFLYVQKKRGKLHLDKPGKRSKRKGGEPKPAKNVA